MRIVILLGLSSLGRGGRLHNVKRLLPSSLQTVLEDRPSSPLASLLFSGPAVSFSLGGFVKVRTAIRSQAPRSFVAARDEPFKGTEKTRQELIGELERYMAEPKQRPEQASDSTPISSYSDTSGGVRGIVSGLTGLVNAIAGALGVDDANDATNLEEREAKKPLTTSELLEGVRADYVERMYLWTGDIDPDLYAEDCVFTDPTLSFKGLSTFQKNLANLQPILKAVVREPNINLFSCELLEESKQVKASWQMQADLALPWKPAINLCGQTVFTYDAEQGNRIVDYAESWELEAGAALMQLLRPKSAAAPTDNDSPE